MKKFKNILSCAECGEKPEYIDEIKTYTLPVFHHTFAGTRSFGPSRAVSICKKCIKKKGKPISIYIGHGERNEIQYCNIIDIVHEMVK